MESTKCLVDAMTDLVNLPFPHPRRLPSEIDVRYTKSLIGHLDRKMEDLENDISKLQTQLQQIQHKRVNLASYICPLRRLPTELLSVIIGIYLKQYGEITIIASVCSRLREVALGMAGVWSNISLLNALQHTRHNNDPSLKYTGLVDPPYGSSHQGGIRCTTLEQLELVLERAGTSPLELSVSFPVEMGTLELIAARDSPIHSLTVIDDLEYSVTDFGLYKLDLGQLQNLRLQGLHWTRSIQIMDLALQSNCHKMTFDINYRSASLESFQHELMRRVVNIGITIGERKTPHL
ncbi:hypothetical protein CPB86DRAFT_57900 [Serendipita vermifera]|nr:hypothetical protein CPB86DRAFT_57900 [Serendipita vermifera]